VTPVPVPPSVALVATDLDGTLLLPDGSVGDRTVAALDALAAAGVDVVLVTGRPPRWVSPVVQRTGPRGTAIAANGAVVLDLAAGVVEVAFPLPAPAALDAIASLRAITPDAVFAVERIRPGAPLSRTRAMSYADLDAHAADPTEYALGIGYDPRWPVPDGTLVAPIEDLVQSDDVVKLLARPGPGGGHDADSFLVVADEVLAGLVEVTHSNTRDVLLEMSALGVSKATTLARVAAARGVMAAQVVAVGDGPNDLPMLRWAGTSYAVANAHPAVLAIADHVLPDHGAEGVADLLEAVLAATR
jgi:hydroxymethylpyrimidine pyrophosphatase-like HAD family hydrolase